MARRWSIQCSFETYSRRAELTAPHPLGRAITRSIGSSIQCSDANTTAAATIEMRTLPTPTDSISMLRAESVPNRPASSTRWTSGRSVASSSTRVTAV
ncbi:hypothetical protein [Streptomyces sp. NPDC005167]|nr:hypothetical protein [Streptomyces sp. AM2-3-1]WNO68901.1 hypothetical protein RPQ02_36335 [Streptomyces sp. AM2-3-1]